MKNINDKEQNEWLNKDTNSQEPKIRELQPLVSVIVPSYNHSKYILTCIESILNQTYKNIEIIVIDDGSSDDSLGLLLEFNKSNKFRLITQENIGLAATLNRGISEFARGDFISICASDDYWRVDKIEKLLDYLTRNPEVPLCYSRTMFVDENDRHLESHTRSANKWLKGGHIFMEIITQKIHFLPGMVRTKVYDEFGLYDKIIWTEDFHLNLKVSKKYKIGFVDEFLNYYRYPAEYSSKLRSIRVPMAHKKCIDEYKSDNNFKLAMREWNFRNFVWFCGNKEQKRFALHGMLNCLSFIYRKQFVTSFLRLIFQWKR